MLLLYYVMSTIPFFQQIRCTISRGALQVYSIYYVLLCRVY